MISESLSVGPPSTAKIFFFPSENKELYVGSVLASGNV